MPDTVLAQLAALKVAPVADLKQKWRDLFDREPPSWKTTRHPSLAGPRESPSMMHRVLPHG